MRTTFNSKSVVIREVGMWLTEVALPFQPAGPADRVVTRARIAMARNDKERSRLVSEYFNRWKNAAQNSAAKHEYASPKEQENASGGPVEQRIKRLIEAYSEHPEDLLFAPKAR